MPETKTLSLESFVDRLIEEKGIALEDPEVFAQLKNDLLKRVEDAINVAVVTKLPEEVLPEMERTLKTGNLEKVRQLAAKHIDNLDEVVAEAMLRFRRVYVNPV